MRQPFRSEIWLSVGVWSQRISKKRLKALLPSVNDMLKMGDLTVVVPWEL
jgi:hypothetical protein